MRITMVKKRLASGEPCRKCLQAEELLRRRGLWDRIDEVVWALEDDPASAGMRLGALHGVDTAPFFLVDDGGPLVVYKSALELIRERLTAPAAPAGLDLAAAAAELEGAHPREVLRFAIERFGKDLWLAFSGSDDVAMIDLAAEAGAGFTVVTVDTGRLHPETYDFVDRVRMRYGLDLVVTSPEHVAVEAFVRKKGLFSFYEDGHEECCAVRKVEPLRRALAGARAWATGQRRDQSATRAGLAIIELDPVFRGTDGPLVKLNPLARWSRAELWDYLRARDLPINPLHDEGFVSIGCAPCTRAIRPGQDEREGRWWWEDARKKECGLHAGNLGG